MPKKSSTKPTDAEELDAFAHHLSEVLRIARDSDIISVRFFNALADAWNDYGSDSTLGDNFWHSEEYIRLTLRKGAEQRAQKKGGAK
jgi:hypothetical protein